MLSSTLPAKQRKNKRLITKFSKKHQNHSNTRALRMNHLPRTNKALVTRVSLPKRTISQTDDLNFHQKSLQTVHLLSHATEFASQAKTKSIVAFSDNIFHRLDSTNKFSPETI